MVTGSGFDFIQTAAMKVAGSNMTAVEVRAPSCSSLLLLFILPPIGLASSFLMFYFAYLGMFTFYLWIPLTIATVAINISARCESISLASFKKKTNLLHGYR